MGVIGLYLILTAAAAGGFAVLRQLGLGCRSAWAGGRVVGLVAVTFPAWWWGIVASAGWTVVLALALAAAAGLGGWRIWRDRRQWREGLQAEAAFLLGTAVVIALRLGSPDILGTEKLMDLGILSSLLRTDSFPPPDMWLSGHTLPYYYWGSLLWAGPLRLAGVPVEIGYNLVIGLVGGLTATVTFALGTELCRSIRYGIVAAFLATLAGTADGFRQLVGKGSLTAIDLWRSSRQDPDVITEFPLFTLHLGDLHPHLLSMPLMVAAWLMALNAGRRGPRWLDGLALALMVGTTWAANPWAMPPTAAGVFLLLVVADGQWRWPTRTHWPRWVVPIAAVVGGWILTAPFHLDFSPPFQGLARVFANTSVPNIVLYGGVLLIPAAGCAIVYLASALPDAEAARALCSVTAAMVVLAACLIGAPSPMLLGAILVLLALAVLNPGEDPDRAALALAVLGVFLFVVPEIAYVKDPYGERLHRMNTVFKAYIAAWPALAVAFPVLMWRWLPRRRLRMVVLVVLIALTLPHPLALAKRAWQAPEHRLYGFGWMTPSDRAAVDVLREQPLDTVVLEAIGGAYTEHARLSSASGVPAFLGWGNHEGVWRGDAIRNELERRKAIARQIYTTTSLEGACHVADQEGIDLIAIGAMERAAYPGPGVDALRAAVGASTEGTILIDVHSQSLLMEPVS
jgi:YYY domain-containing protein